MDSDTPNAMDEAKRIHPSSGNTPFNPDRLSIGARRVYNEAIAYKFPKPQVAAKEVKLYDWAADCSIAEKLAMYFKTRIKRFRRSKSSTPIRIFPVRFEDLAGNIINDWITN